MPAWVMSLAPSNVTDDTLLNGRVLLRQPAAGYRAGIDAVFLAAAVPAQAGDRVLDLGLGTGAAALCLLARVPEARMAGLEREAAYAALARYNATANRRDLQVVEGDVGAPPDLGLFDHVLTNPPFIEDGQGTRARDPARAAAHSGDVPLAHWLAVAGRLLRPGGTLTVVFPARREGELLAGLPAGDVRLYPLLPRAGRAPKRLIVQVRTGRPAALTRLPGLILHGDAPGFTAAAESILREGQALPLDGEGAAA